MVGIRLWRWRRRWWCWGLALALPVLLLVPRVLRVELHARSALPRPPAAVAHLLADFSRRPDVTSWRVESDRSNYTSWRYSVRFECGRRCAGEAAVEAHAGAGPEAGAGAGAGAGAAPAHGRARHHEVRVRERVCSALPLLPWPYLCEEVETVSLVRSDDGGGALLEQRASTHCAVLGGACAGHLRARLRAALQRLHSDLDSLPPRY